MYAGWVIICWRAMPEAEMFVCLSAKQTTPAMMINTALREVRSMVVFENETLDTLAFPNTPRLKMSNSAPNTIPLMPASESIRFTVNE